MGKAISEAVSDANTHVEAVDDDHSVPGTVPLVAGVAPELQRRGVHAVLWPLFLSAKAIGSSASTNLDTGALENVEHIRSPEVPLEEGLRRTSA
jgi:hypothetical protein